MHLSYLFIFISLNIPHLTAVKMAKNHAAKVQRYEYNLQKGLREKQQAFEASFKEEMYHYKKYGKPSKQRMLID